jgi:HEPN domain
LTEDQQELLEKACESLEAAKLLLKGAYPDFAASRAYYAMFYIAQALLEGEGLAFSRHSAVIAAFGQHFAHTGKVPTTSMAFSSKHKICGIVETMGHPMLSHPIKLGSRSPTPRNFSPWPNASPARSRLTTSSIPDTFRQWRHLPLTCHASPSQPSSLRRNGWAICPERSPRPMDPSSVRGHRPAVEQGICASHWRHSYSSSRRTPRGQPSGRQRSGYDSRTIFMAQRLSLPTSDPSRSTTFNVQAPWIDSPCSLCSSGVVARV